MNTNHSLLVPSRKASEVKKSTIRRALARLLLAGAALLMAATALPTRASDPIGIYAIIEKAVLQPSADKPERIALWGHFSLATSERGSVYEEPKTGVLYFKLPEEKAEVARKEWKDLQAIAGTGQVIGFASRYADKGRVRTPEEKLENPDVYPLGWGLNKTRKSDFAPIRKLIEHAGAHKRQTGAEEAKSKTADPKPAAKQP